MCRQFNTCDSLLCVNVRIRYIVVCPFSTIFTTQMDWWQLIDFDNPDNEFSVVRNIYRSVSMSRITLRWKRYPQEALQNSGIGGHNHPSHYNDESGWIQTPYFHYITSFMGIPNSMRILYKTSLLSETQVFLKSINS